MSVCFTDMVRREELTKAGAGYLAADVEELEQLYCPVFGSRTDSKKPCGLILPHGFSVEGIIISFFIFPLFSR